MFVINVPALQLHSFQIYQRINTKQGSSELRRIGHTNVVNKISELTLLTTPLSSGLRLPTWFKIYCEVS